MPQDDDVFTLSKGRFEAFSDGVFAIAITLLILEIHLPARVTAQSSLLEQAQALGGLWKEYLVYFAAFLSIGIMWINHHALFRYVETITHGMTVANLFLLAVVSFMPFATLVLGQWEISPMSIVFYGALSFLMSIGYTVLRWQVVSAHPHLPQGLNIWNGLGLAVYPIATVVGFFVPVAGILILIAVTLWYMMPQNVRAGAVKP